MTDAGSQVKVRSAKPVDYGRFFNILNLVDSDVPHLARAQLRNGDLGMALTQNPSGGPSYRKALSRALNESTFAVNCQSAVALVAELDGEVVGALYAGAPIKVLNHTQSEAPQHTLAMAIAMPKLFAVVVLPDARRRGVGGLLVAEVRRLYAAAGAVVLYGGFDIENPVEKFYDGLGFVILGPGQGVNFHRLTGIPLAGDLGSQPYQRLILAPNGMPPSLTERGRAEWGRAEA